VNPLQTKAVGTSWVPFSLRNGNQFLRRGPEDLLGSGFVRKVGEVDFFEHGFCLKIVLRTDDPDLLRIQKKDKPESIWANPEGCWSEGYGRGGGSVSAFRLKDSSPVR